MREFLTVKRNLIKRFSELSFLQEIWSRRSLIRTFAINDLRIRYRNSILGFFWSFLEPLLMLSVLYVVFTQLFKNDIPNYGLYLLLGLVMWGFFARATTIGSASIIVKGGIVNKIYFPREILPISACITAFLMMSLEFIVFFAFIIGLQFLPPATILILPFLLILEFILALAIALPLSVLNAYYRDIQYIWGVIVYAGFFVTPIFYTSDILPENIRQIYFLNPMAQLIDFGHNAVLFNKLPSAESLIYTVGVIFAILAIGYAIFHKYEKRVAQEL